jgi:hypothetical protein
MSRRSGRRQTFAAIWVAAVLVAAVSACGTQRAQRTGSASSSAIAAAVGHKWQLTQVTTNGRRVGVPGSLGATFQLTSDGRFLASDSVNALSGTYVATPTGFRVTKAATTLVGYSGTDPTRLAVIAGMNGVLMHEGAVAANATGRTLTLNAANYELSFRNAGSAVSFPPASATATITTTHR